MKGLNRTQLKIIAISAMVCDHIAWGFLDFMTPLAQVLHIIGRLTIPIMCFFIAEGFRKTSNLRAYISRMVCFWLVTIIPFYRFFGDMYEYRQNIIFDLLLGLFTLTVLESKKMKKILKVVLVAVLFLISMTVGGWPILPTFFILVFYYVKDFKKQVIWISGLTVGLVVFLAVAIYLNNIWHFSNYDWIWYEKLYFMGFVLALIPIKFYNHENGKTVIFKHFFYAFYPLHFMLLTFVRDYIVNYSPYEIYTLVQVIALALSIGVVAHVATIRPSKLQIGTLMFSGCSLIYTFGFLVEITSYTVEGVYSAIKMEYFGECLLIICFTMFLRECSHKVIYRWVYLVECLVTVWVTMAVFTVNDNHIFYKSMAIDYSGEFPHIVLEYGIGFYLFISYLFIVCVTGIVFIIIEYRQNDNVGKKRMMCLLIAIVSVWVPYLLKLMGLTGGYEIPSIGIVGAVIAIGTSIIKYNSLDSVTIASENALLHGHEGILVVDNNSRLLFSNKHANALFGTMDHFTNICTHSILRDFMNNNINQFTQDGKTYELRKDPLMEGGCKQGDMIWVLDITNHYNRFMEVNKLAKHDALTGLNNRISFELNVKEYLSKGNTGAMLMLDLDNFKNVNDTYGHQTGDEVLIIFGNAIMNSVEKTDYAARFGGDEFCIFCKEKTDKTELENISQSIIDNLKNELGLAGYGGFTTASIGIAIVRDDEAKAGIDFEQLYTRADKALYLSKNSGKNIYKFFE